jgi:hypothetical protein
LILVVVQAADVERVSEALRAGIGLGLRGDPVAVLLTGAAARFADGSADPRIERALSTLAELGRPARVVPADELASWLARARAVELWTSGQDAADAGSVRRRLAIGEREIEIVAEPELATATGSGPKRFRAGGRAIDAADLVEQILGSDGPIVVR